MATCNIASAMSSGSAGVAGRPHMHGELLVVAKRRQEGQCDHRAFPQRPVRPGPDCAPRTFVDHSLESGVKPRRRSLGPIDVRVTQHLAADFQPGFAPCRQT